MQMFLTAQLLENIVRFLCVSVFPLSALGAGQCGQRRQDLSHLTGGREAVSGGWPWQVRLGVRQNGGFISWICGGSILSEKYVITAAHCLDSGPNAQYVVRIGDHDSSIFERGQEDIPVVRYRIQEQYAQHNHFANDIAILRLARPPTWGPRVSTVCLPGTNDDPSPGNTCYVTGWGLTGAGNSPYSNVLRQARVGIIARNECRERSYWGYGVKNTNICAGYLEGKIDACKGDSGGPLVCLEERTGRWILEGLVSYGWDKGCGFPGKPAVYTRVASYLNWISAVTGNTLT
ncbi:putative Chymotrypsin-like elastase family member 2A [Hypsibius exemplaris]|uniref:Chymotrypsin-like elastase family member 2A n=1 Tax=Hypsibius exemplaris TaxID=2072580 RepID=A0A9X6RK12_HYPEX|nr:putative Chymotrypsin-like elastase family member 2A [Hypsibius exemplaris]